MKALENKNVHVFRGTRNQGTVYGNWVSLGKESIVHNKEGWRESPVVMLLPRLISGFKLVTTFETVTYKPASSQSLKPYLFFLV